MSMFLKNMLEDIQGAQPIVIGRNVAGYDLQMIRQYCSYRCLDTKRPIEVFEIKSRSKDERSENGTSGLWQTSSAKIQLYNFVGLSKAAH
ncbi:hypothetical protein BDK51DRAFT_48620 [Blyttiomyces helicus]|uniref:Uncharacterized protein n=1 Tax=Blyttiomyces helicus TaxID=388810 RepID=A0A4P9WQ15_9FUNG|nr:hypothetical protein BDK51DRAFT_48620 [Blyttiomyces helicus]|eukprot:RKO94455.1 hypothetical protein BDK51DRAFT_48620 [Blyttiomyces helicus]